MNYDIRKDCRTNQEFAQDIKNSTLKELYLVTRWQLEVQLQGKLWSIVPWGIDITGKVNKGKQSGSPDFKLMKENENSLLEVKNTPVLDKCTFKVQSLKNIIKYSADLLVFFNTGQIKKHSISEMDLSKAYWALAELPHVKTIYNDYQDKIFRWKYFGNKEVIQILQKDYSKYFELHKFRFQL